MESKEIDIYLPQLKLGFELNVVYWHSDKFRNKNFHKEKSEFFSKNDIRVVHIWEDDFDNKFDIIKSQIINLIGKSNKIWARKCRVKEVDDIDLVKDFINENHIQGYVNSNFKLGLYYNDELVSLMTFDHFEGRKKMNESEWNLNRFCNKKNTSVVGGASKLLKYFISKYEPIRIISYADRDWSKGDLYEKLGFNKISQSRPDYKYLVGDKRVHKSNFKKSITGISESELIIPKIWDCGKIKYEMSIQRQKVWIYKYMILTREIKIKINEQNYQYYEDLGYEVSFGEIITIPVDLLSKGSQYKIMCKCDMCGIEKEVIYKNYIKYGNNWGDYKCRKCSEIKRKETLRKNFGVDYPLQNKRIMKRTKKTLITKYGVDNMSKIDKKQKQTQND